MNNLAPVRWIAGLLVALLGTTLAVAQIGPPPGGGGGGGSGTVTNIATACGVSGGPITTTGTIQGSAAFNAQTGTSYAMQNSDCGKVVTLSNAAAVAVSIAQAGGGGNFAAAWFATVKNLGVGTVTITPTTSTIDGAANLALTTNQSVDLYSDGTNYFTGRGIGGGGSGTVTTTGSPASGNLTRFSGATSITSDNLSGDCTTNGALVTSCPTLGFPYRTGSFQVGGAESMAGVASSATAFTANVARCYPGYLRSPGGTVISVGVRINVTAASGIDLAVYLNNPTTARPTGLPLFNTLNLSGASAAFVSGAVSYSFTQNVQVWFCIVSNNTTVTTNGMVVTLATSGIMGGAANTLLSGTSIVNGITFAQTQNTAWPDLTSPPAFTEVANITHNAIILGF